jgi:transcriptional regulator with PAS, ATPase and Fis domain
LTDLDCIASELESVTKLYDTLQSVLEIAYDGIIVVDKKGIITMVNQSAADFFHKPVENMVGKPVDKIVENSRLYEVVKTGVAELHQLQFIGGTPYVVSRMPIVRDGKVLGAVGKILFNDFKDVRNLARKFIGLDQKVAYYKNQIRNGSNNRITFDQIITSHVTFKKIKERAEIAARGSSSILITGESGTGKEMIAQSIHEAGVGRYKRLIKINCAAIPAELLESEFFGYAPGAFTGAQKKGRQGKLALADGGTLFLDEIGDMGSNLQSKLLRVLQDKSFEPIGSDKTIRVNFRVIAATNQDLYQMVQEKRFRGDLYYRLNVIHFHIPPLRERPQDIILLVHFFIEKYNHILGSGIQDISDDAMNILLHHTWPGNVRELENVIERVANFVKGSTIKTSDLPLNLREKHKNPPHLIKQMPAKQLFQASRENHEKLTIQAALKKTDGNKAQAARILGISRSWLYTKMSRVGL